MKKIIFFILAILFLFNLSYADELNIPVKEYVLPNGLTVLIVERRDAPVFSANILCRVGSVNDPVGLTGVAHMLEHMMFKGTGLVGTTNYKAEIPILQKINKLVKEIEKEKAKGITNPSAVNAEKINRIKKEIKNLEKENEKYVIPYEIWTLYEKNGASGLNAYTAYDSTKYVISLPSNKLELWAYLESDRLKNPVFRIFNSEKDTVAEERKQNLDSVPSSKLFEDFFAAMYQAVPYHHEIIGWPSDIENYTPDAVVEIFKRNYSPCNIVIAVVGDVNAEKTVNIIKKYFGGMRNFAAVRPLFTEEIPQEHQRRVVLKRNANPKIMIGFHGPKPVSRECYALDILSEIMSSGKTSRLYKELVENKKMASSVSFSAWSLKYAVPVIVSVYPADGVNLNDLESEIFKQIDKLKTEKVSGWELQKAKNNFIAQFVRGVRDNANLADALVVNEGIFGSWEYFDLRKQYESVTAEDIQKAAQKYLNKDNSTVATLVK